MTPRSSWEDIAPLPSWQKYIEEILNKKYGPNASQEKVLPNSHPGRKKIEPNIWPTAILTKNILKQKILPNCRPSTTIFETNWTEMWPLCYVGKRQRSRRRL